MSYCGMYFIFSTHLVYMRETSPLNSYGMHGQSVVGGLPCSFTMYRNGHHVMQGSMINQLTWLCEIAPLRRSSMPNACSPKRKEPDRNGEHPIERAHTHPIETECSRSSRNIIRQKGETSGAATRCTVAQQLRQTERQRFGHQDVKVVSRPF